MSDVVTICRLPRCHAQVPTWKLMCALHWSLVPRAIQRRVFATLSVYKERGSEAAHAQYLHAVDDAVQAVRVAIDRKAASNAQ